MEKVDIAELPDDGLAEVLGVLPPRSLAVARCVCKAWRDIIDARALLHPHLLPHKVRGVFCNYVDHGRPHLFVRPSSSSTFPMIDGLLSFMPNERDWWTVLDHCNGLVLCKIKWESQLLVCNPATQRWTLLPRQTEVRSCAYISFDPTVSSHYEVFLIPDVPEKPKPAAQAIKRKAEQALDAPFCLDWLFSLPEGALSIDEDQTVEEDLQPVESPSTMDEVQDHDPCRLMEWPPSPWSLKVFSSATGLWEERQFVREGQPAGTVEDMRLDRKEPTWQGPRQRYAVYQNGRLYVHCRGSFMARFSLSNGKYQVIKMPTEAKGVKPYLGRSENRVYFGIVDDRDRQLRVWMLSESCGHMEWLLKYAVDIGLYADHVASLPYKNGRLQEGSWMVEEANNYVSDTDSDSNAETQSEDSTEWDSDKDDIFTAAAGDEYRCEGWFDILGFHPYKEVVFLANRFGVASYHFTSSKIQYLGNSRPRCYYRNHTYGIYESFVYTPCMIGDLLYGDDIEDTSFED